MAISSLINMASNLGVGAMNIGSTILTNQSNERNVDKTNAANVAMNAATNAANLSIAEKTNESNERIMQQTNEFNAAQADLAYQRSTSSAKVGELISAGLSPQQARQVVASAGLTGNASAAQGTAIPAQGATMQAPQIEPFQKAPLDFSKFGDGIHSLGTFFDKYIESFDREDGGYYGTILANDAFEMCLEHITDLTPTALSSNYNFNLWLDLQTSDYWQTFKESDAFAKVKKNPLAYRSFFYRLNKSFKDAADVQNALDLAEIQKRREALQEINDQLQNKFTDQQIHNAIKTGIKIDAEVNNLELQSESINIQNQRSKIVLDRDQKTANLVTDAEIARLRRAIADDKLQERLLTDPTYMEAYFGAALNNQLWQCALNSYSARIADKQNNFLADSPDDELTIAIFSLLDQVGFENTQLCQDLKENYLAGSSIADYMLKKTMPLASANTADNLYDSLRPLWKKQAKRPLTTKEKWQVGTDVVGTFLW